MLGWLADPALLLLSGARLGNLVLSFWGALLLALCAAHCTRSPRVQKYVLLVPLLKLGFVLGAAVPADNYTLSSFAGTRWDLGRFGFGLRLDAESWVPAVELRLSALRAERWHSLSGGDLLTHALYYRGAALVLVALLLVAASVALVRIAKRLAAWRAFAREVGSGIVGPRRDRGLRIGRTRLRRRSGLEHGAFTAGILRPAIYLPRRSAGLSAAEIAAVLRHELAHVRHGDVALFACIGLVRDVLWFVPGIGLLARRIHDSAERAADAWAVSRGADPTALASALIAVAERRVGRGAIAGAGGATPAARRIAHLLRPAPEESRWQFTLGVALSTGIAAVALRSTFFGY